MSVSLHLLFAANSLFGPQDLPESQRIDRLRPYFDPPPGTEVSADAFEVTNRAKGSDPMTLRGFIKISPPKNHCFIITRHFEDSDRRVCSPETVSFTLETLDNTGRVTWLVKTGDGDFGTELTWPTPHRIAQVARAGDGKLNEPVSVPTASCKAFPATRTIKVTLITGETWVISLPEKDTLVPQPKPVRNLFMQKGPRRFISGQPDPQSILTDDDEEELSEQEVKAQEKQKAPDQGVEESTKKSGFLTFKRVKKVVGSEYNWNLLPRYAFGMDADRIKINDAPSGLNGKCRYKLSEAPLDAASGVIECHDTDAYDALLVYLPCARELLGVKP